MGTTGDQLAAGAPMMVGMGMGGLGMPGFTDMVTTAIGSFLKDKGTLSVEAQPEDSISVLDLVMTSQTDPKKLPEMLNMQVRAQP